MSDLIGTFKKPFKEAIAAFRLRMANPVPTAKWDDLWQSQHDRAFMVAGATKADLLADLAKAVEKAIAEGTSLEEFRAMLLAAYPKLDAGPLASLIGDALVVGHGAGRADVVGEGG